MATDIRLTIPNKRFNYGTATLSLKKILTDSFGDIDFRKAGSKDLRIYATPEQVISFLIQRDQEDLPNLIKELNMRFVPREPVKNVFEVRTRR